MFERKPDPRDQIIALLREDKMRLELRVAELTKQLIALTSRAAFREVYRPEAPTPQAKAVAAPLNPRTVTYVPKKSFKDIEEALNRRELEGTKES
jgi:hypothetical protein